MSNATPNGGILIVGASGGIGTELCKLLTQQGEKLFLLSRNQERLQSLATELNQPYAVCDASNWEELNRCTADANSLLGGIKAATNLAGSVLLKPAHLTTAEELQSCLNASLWTAFGLVRAVAPIMRRAGGGSIVLVSSAAAHLGLANHEAIAAAKGAVDGLMLSAAATYGPSGIRVNAIAPGLVETGLTEKIWGQAKVAESSRAMHTLGRFGTPQEIAGAIAWLMSTESSWITGQKIAIDGGLSGTKVLRATP